VAASVTYGIGKAATTYYLQGVEKENIKKLFLKSKK